MGLVEEADGRLDRPAVRRPDVGFVVGIVRGSVPRARDPDTLFDVFAVDREWVESMGPDEVVVVSRDEDAPNEPADWAFGPVEVATLGVSGTAAFARYWNLGRS